MVGVERGDEGILGDPGVHAGGVGGARHLGKVLSTVKVPAESLAEAVATQPGAVFAARCRQDVPD